MPLRSLRHASVWTRFGISFADPKRGVGNKIMKYNQGTIVPGFSYAPPLAQTRKCLDSFWGIKKPDYVRLYFISYCREEGIRTLDTVSRIHTFQACSFNHSDTSLYSQRPILIGQGVQIYAILPYFPNISSARFVVHSMTVFTSVPFTSAKR